MSVLWKKCHLTFWNKTRLISKIWTTKKPAPQSSAAHPGAHPSSRTFKHATITHKNVSRHCSPPPVTATSRRSMSNIYFSLINQALVVSYPFMEIETVVVVDNLIEL
jgi:hypothetical protein